MFWLGCEGSKENVVVMKTHVLQWPIKNEPVLGIVNYLSNNVHKFLPGKQHTHFLPLQPPLSFTVLQFFPKRMHVPPASEHSDFILHGLTQHFNFFLQPFSKPSSVSLLLHSSLHWPLAFLHFCFLRSWFLSKRGNHACYTKDRLAVWLQ